VYCKDSSLDERQRGTRRWCGLKFKKATRRGRYAVKFSTTAPRLTRSQRSWHLESRPFFSFRESGSDDQSSHCCFFSPRSVFFL